MRPGRFAEPGERRTALVRHRRQNRRADRETVGARTEEPRAVSGVLNAVAEGEELAIGVERRGEQVADRDARQRRAARADHSERANCPAPGTAQLALVE